MTRRPASLDAMEHMQAGARRATREILDDCTSPAAARGLTPLGALR